MRGHRQLVNLNQVSHFCNDHISASVYKLVPIKRHPIRRTRIKAPPYSRPVVYQQTGPRYQHSSVRRVASVRFSFKIVTVQLDATINILGFRVPQKPQQRHPHSTRSHHIVYDVYIKTKKNIERRRESEIKAPEELVSYFEITFLRRIWREKRPKRRHHKTLNSSSSWPLRYTRKGQTEKALCVREITWSFCAAIGRNRAGGHTFRNHRSFADLMRFVVDVFLFSAALKAIFLFTLRCAGRCAAQKREGTRKKKQFAA